MTAGFLRNALDYLLGGPAVGGPDEDRLRRWFAIEDADLALPHARARYVAVATAASASHRRPRASTIAAVAVDRAEVELAGCFDASLEGTPSQSKSTMLDFLEFLRKSPIVAFDARSEAQRLERAMKSLLGVPLRHRWIDLGSVLNASFPGARCATLDDWLARFGVPAAIEDATLGRAFAAAQLLQIALGAAARSGATNARALIDMPPA